MTDPTVPVEQKTTPHGFWAGRSGLVLPVLLAGFSTYLTVGNLRMLQPDDVDFPGPTFFPWLLAVAGFVVSALLLAHYLRHREFPDDTTPSRSAGFTDWASVAWCVGGFALFALSLEFLGWILAGGLLFWCVTRAFGSRRPLFDASLALVMSSLVYLAFDVALGLSLPSGIIGGGL